MHPSRPLNQRVVRVFANASDGYYGLESLRGQNSRVALQESLQDGELRRQSLSMSSATSLPGSVEVDHHPLDQ